MSEYTYKAKVGQRWLRGNSLVDTEKDADTFESKTEPTERINQMKQDGKISKSANVEIVEESSKIDYANILNEERNIRYVIKGIFECNGKEKIFYYNKALDNWAKHLVNPDPTQLGNATQFKDVPKDETMEAALDTAVNKERCAVRFEDPDYELVDIIILELLKSGHGFSRISQRSWPNGKRESLSESTALNYSLILCESLDSLKKENPTCAFNEQVDKSTLKETKSMTKSLYDFVVDNWIYDDELQDAENSTELADIIKSRIDSGWGPDVSDRIIYKVADYLWEDYFLGDY